MGGRTSLCYLIGVAILEAAAHGACNRAPTTTSTTSTSTAAPPTAIPNANAAAGPHANGATGFKASQAAIRTVRQFTLDQTQTTDIGVFKEMREVDCASPYYHYRLTKDLTPRGIEANTTQLQGPPRPHQETERLFVDGKSFNRFTGSWEHPADGTDDAHPAWGPSLNSYDPTAECQSFQQAAAIPFVPFDKILAANTIEYLGQRAADDTQCHEYRVTYPDLVDSDQMKTVDTGGGFSTSYREQVTRPVRATICLGATDFLPRHGAGGDTTFRYAYKTFEKLVAP